MDYHKIPYKVRKFAQRYESRPSVDDLYTIKRDFNPEKEESFYNAMKHLYLCYSIKCGLPEWYLSLVQYRLKTMEAYFIKYIEDIIAEAKLSENTDAFIDNKLLKHYRDKGSFYLTPVMDNLPLHLRLKLYLHLYREELSPDMHCYLRHRMAALLAKLDKVTAAQQLSVYNWVLAKSVEASHFCDVSALNQTLKAHKVNSNEISHWKVNHEASLLAQEISVYYKTLLEDPFSYTTANMSTLELVSLCYEHYPQLVPLTFTIKSYLRTRNLEAFHARLEEHKRTLIYHHEETIWLDEDLKDQFIIIKELLKIGAKSASA
ncbi:MAG: hypothetical protein FWF59_12375 [Turicibacter sp.]|nr:hypothetical protein [Turicibacter sp.]